MTINDLLRPYSIRETKRFGYAISYQTVRIGHVETDRYITAVRVADACRQAGIKDPSQYGSTDQVNAYARQGYDRRTIKLTEDPLAGLSALERIDFVTNTTPTWEPLADLGRSVLWKS